MRLKQLVSVVGAGVWLLAVCAPEAGATAFIYNDFSSTAGLTINANAAQAGTALRVVPALQNQVGTAFFTSAVDVSAFSTAFSFKITAPFNDGADGFTFAVQRNGANAVGGLGGSLGYGGLGSSAAVEFDTWNNGFPYDSSGNHVGIDTGGSVISNVTANVAPSFENGQVWYAWVDYNGSQLDLFLSTTGVKPVGATLSYVIDLPTVIGGSSAWVGFTAGTGFAGENVDILSWSFKDAPEIPEPGTLGLLGGALLGLSIWRRRVRT